jgi:hypothetical protein
LIRRFLPGFHAATRGREMMCVPTSKVLTSEKTSFHGICRHYGRLFLPIVLVFSSPARCQIAALTLGAGSDIPGATVAIGITLSTNTLAPLAGLQWTVSYPPTQVSGITVIDGAAATAAGKTVSCSGGPGVYRCIVAGANQNLISTGVVALLSIQIAPAAAPGSFPLELSGLLGTSELGTPVAVAGANGLLTVLAPPVQLSSLDCAPASVTSPGTSTCTVGLTGAAPGRERFRWRSLH